MTRQPNEDDDLMLALAAKLRAAPPPRETAQADALARAMEAFEENRSPAQDLNDQMRSNQDRPQPAGILTGVRLMLANLKLKPWLAGSSAVAALALGLVVILPQMQHPSLVRPAPPQPAAAPPVTAPQPTVAPPIAAPPVVPAPLANPASPPPPAMLPSPQAHMPAQGRMAAAQAEMAQGASASAKMRMAPASAETAAEIASRMATGMTAEMAPAMASDMSVAAPMAAPDHATEAYANAPANAVKSTLQEPVSTFSADVDTASYALIRNSLTAGFLPEPDAVRVEEMINYFPYAYAAPSAEAAPFQTTLSVIPSPWNAGTKLVEIGIQGRLPLIETRPPLNLVFLIDTSGSMDEPSKLPLLRQALGLMLSQLRAEDQVAIVAYAGSAGEVLSPTPASARAKILAALDRLEAGGSTNGAEGLDLAYQLAAQMTKKGDISRVLLATDGDFNIGLQEPEALERLIKDKAKAGTYLSVLGFGRGNLDDQIMQSLAQNGNGMAAYIDTLQEAQKVLVDQLSGALFPIADDVKLQVEWNPAQVAEYRLIGYETRALRREDFNNDKVDAGEIGAGHQVTAIYEITPPGSPAILHDPLRYGTAAPSIAPQTKGEELGFLRLRYKEPGQNDSRLIETALPVQTASTPDAAFAAAIAGFGQLLRGSAYLGDWGWDEAIALANANRGDDPFGYRSEAVQLMRLAQSLSR